MWRTVPPLSRGSVLIFREMYEMSQVCLVYYSWNWWNIIKCSFCNATSLEYPLDTWCWLGSSLDIPYMFCSHQLNSMKLQKTSFENSLDRTDDVLHYPYFCSDKQFGEYNFWEVVKIDLSIQRSTQTKEQNYERYVSNSMSLVKVLFEELHPAIDCINDLGRQTMKAKLDQHFTLFN